MGSSFSIDQGRKAKEPRHLYGILTLIVAGFALMGCGQSAQDFQKEDPSGFQVCQAFESAQGGGGDFYRRHSGHAAEQASQSTNEDLRTAVEAMGYSAPAIYESSMFRKACKKAGYDF